MYYLVVECLLNDFMRYCVPLNNRLYDYFVASIPGATDSIMFACEFVVVSDIDRLPCQFEPSWYFQVLPPGSSIICPYCLAYDLRDLVCPYSGACGPQAGH